MSDHVFTATLISPNRSKNTIASIFSKRTNRCILILTDDYIDIPPSILLYGRFVFCHGTVPSYQTFVIRSNAVCTVKGIRPLTVGAYTTTLLVAEKASHHLEVPSGYRTKFILPFTVEEEDYHVSNPFEA